MFDQQVADKMGPFFSEVFLPTMRRLVDARLSYERVKALLEIPPAVGAKITAEEFEQRASAFLTCGTAMKRWAQARRDGALL